MVGESENKSRFSKVSYEAGSSGYRQRVSLDCGFMLIIRKVA